ncbi:MAG TPA: PAS domain S-box protein [Azospirillaceae bacterium]|nr:PAS domain S-box protein [Azospirillaceae bacterium]
MQPGDAYLIQIAFAAVLLSWIVIGFLIWKLQAARKALGHSHGQAEAILGAAVDGIVTINDAGIIENFNPAAERIFGYEAREVLGRNVSLLMPEPYRSEHDGYIAAYKATNKPKIIGIGREVIGQRKDGSTFPLDLAVGENRNRGRRLFAGVVRDISERKRAERQLRESEAQTRAILETAVDGIITIDEHGSVLSLNAAAEHLFGYGAAEVVGRNVKMLMPEPYRSAHDEYLANYRQTGERKIIGIGREVQGLRKDGSVFPLELSVGEAVVSGTRFFTGIVRDISERKKTEEELRHSEERFRLLIENVRDYAITWLDIDGRIVSWSTGGERIYGWSAEEIIGQPMSKLYPSEAMDGADAALALVRENGRYEGEGWRLRKDGSLFWAHVVITPLWDEHRQMRGFVRVARDMTDRKQAEEALRTAKEEAERANIAKSKFLAAASHDLRQPVQALVFFATALSDRVQDPAARPVLSDLRESLASLNVLLDSLLDVSRLDAGIVTPRETNFSLAALLEQVTAEFAPLAADKKLRLRNVLSSAIIRSDPTLLGRILRNFVSNAVRYTHTGGIVIGCRRAHNALRIEVWDSGVGIPTDRRQDIFQEFYQIGNPERDRAQGLGLGLAIVKRLASLLDLPVTLRSREGKGSVFAIEVPLVGYNRSRNVESMRAPDVLSASRDKGTILVIDDEAYVLKGLQMVLEAWGYDVLAASSEEEAIGILKEAHRPPDIILADYRLRGGHTGTEAIQHIRQLFDRLIPSILITGDTGPDRLREARASGLELLHKPVQPPELQITIAEYLREARTRR